ncbi:hypothetical protein XHC_0263 [Xanthomonas hortorum pv. carotae str. M081]|nr:hypothetical protein XHC_0263 [Xanthomonas hortorum pv. carotae str. M081]
MHPSLKLQCSAWASPFRGRRSIKPCKRKEDSTEDRFLHAVPATPHRAEFLPAR